MGSLYTYKCDSCDYKVESTGKLDYGYMAVVKPYICNSCKDVFDVMVGEVGQVIPEENLNEEQRTEFYSCPECKGKNLTIWNAHYRKCPKCDGRMTLDKTAFPILWD